MNPNLIGSLVGIFISTVGVILSGLAWRWARRANENAEKALNRLNQFTRVWYEYHNDPQGIQIHLTEDGWITGVKKHAQDAVELGEDLQIKLTEKES